MSVTSPTVISKSVDIENLRKAHRGKISDPQLSVLFCALAALRETLRILAIQHGIAGELALQNPSCDRLLARRHFLGRARDHDAASSIGRSRSDINDPISRLHQL